MGCKSDRIDSSQAQNEAASGRRRQKGSGKAGEKECRIWESWLDDVAQQSALNRQSQAPMYATHLGSRNPNFPPEKEDKEEKGKELMRCESTRQHQEARMDMLLIFRGIIFTFYSELQQTWHTVNWG